MTRRTNLFALFCLCSIALLVAMGCWQLARLEWKRDLTARKDASLNAAPASYPFDGEIEEFRRIKVAGTYQHKAEILLNAKYYKGKLGYNIITPLLTEDGTVIFINRGWVDKDKKLQESRPETLRDRDVIVTGVLFRHFKEPASFLPQNKPEEGFWIWENPEAFASYTKEHFGLNAVPVYLQEIRKGGYPVALTPEFEFRNDHMEYAITWFSLAVVVFIMLLLYRKRA